MAISLSKHSLEPSAKKVQTSREDLLQSLELLREVNKDYESEVKELRNTILGLQSLINSDENTQRIKFLEETLIKSRPKNAIESPMVHAGKLKNQHVTLSVTDTLSFDQYTDPAQVEQKYHLMLQSAGKVFRMSSSADLMSCHQITPALVSDIYDQMSEALKRDVMYQVLNDGR